MRTILLALLVATPALAGCASEADEASATDVGNEGSARDERPFDRSGPYSRVRTPGPLARLPDEIVILPSDVDGQPLQIGLVRPATHEKVPVLLIATVWYPDLRRGPLAERDEGGTPAAFLIENYVPHGYAVALFTARGTGGSGGCEVVTPATFQDLDQVLTWLGTREWSSGRIGMYGLSAGGILQWAGAASGNPHLSTIVPTGSTPDLFGLGFRNGTTNGLLATVVAGQAAIYGARDAETRAAAAPRCAEATGSYRWLATAHATGRRPPQDDWIDMRSHVLQKYRGSVLLVHHFRDATVHPHNVHPFANALVEAGIPLKQVLGQGYHPDMMDTSVTTTLDAVAIPPNPTLRWDWAELVLAWYDRWLKDDLTARLGAPVEVADTRDEWRTEDAWPPADARPLELHLRADHGLGPASAERGVALVAPGAPAAVFATERAPSEIRFAGSPQLHVTVTPLGPAGALHARLLVGAREVGWAAMDLRYHEGGETPRSITPGTPILARMEFQPMDVVVPQGERVHLVVDAAPAGGSDSFPVLSLHHGALPSPVRLELGDEQGLLRALVFERGADKLTGE